MPACTTEPAAGVFPDLFPRAYSAAYRSAFRLLGDRQQAASIAQEAVAGADAVLVFRRARIRAVRACRTAGLLALRRTAQQDAVPQDERARLRAALRALPAQARAVFLLVHLAAVPVDDVAAAMGFSRTWCETQLRRAEEKVSASYPLRIPAPRRPGETAAHSERPGPRDFLGRPTPGRVFAGGGR